jgi:glycerol-3-phosphate dehydrogenase
LVHPRDGKRLFAFPWENIAMIGTTNHDHTSDLDEEPCASLDEREYLLELAQWAFPCQELVQSDVQATYAGVRPVVNTGRKDPGMESREHVIWRENGLLTVSGGKLTTFRLMAYQALRLALPERADDLRQLERQPEGVLDRLPQGIDFPAGVDETMQVRLLGRYGADLSGFLNDARPEELSPIDNTTFYWAELRWAARHGAVQRLSDLLFRRVRLGLLLSRGGLHHLARIRSIVQAELGWDDLRWQAEQSAYEQLWQECYAW